MQAPQSRKGSALSTSHDHRADMLPQSGQQLLEPCDCARLSLNLLLRGKHWLTAT